MNDRQSQAEAVRRMLGECEQAVRDQRWSEALDGFRRLLTILRGAGDRLAEVRILLRAGQVAEAAGRDGDAEEDYRQARALAEQLDDRGLLAAALHRLGHLLRMANPPVARDLFARSLQAGGGDAEGDALSLAMIGQIDFTEGDRFGGLSMMLDALDRMPPDAPTREHLTEHIVYFGGKLPPSEYTRLVEEKIDRAELKARLLQQDG